VTAAWFIGLVLCTVAACGSGGTAATPRSIARVPVAAPPVGAPDELDWMHDEAAAFARARSESKAVVIDFYAAWCTPCVELDRWLATRDAYQVIAPSFVALRFDVTDDSDEVAEKRQRYGAATLPSLLFVGIDGSVFEQLSQLLEPAELLDMVRAASAKLRH